MPASAKYKSQSAREPSRTGQETTRTSRAGKDTSRTAKETTRTGQEMARQEVQEGSRTGQDTARTLSRTTLQPSVQDFSGKIINRPVDRDELIWTVGTTQLRFLHSYEGGPDTFHVPATVQRISTFTPWQWDSIRLPLVPNALRTDRVAAWTEDVHRRHVARTARARARLSPKPKVLERVVPTTASDISDNFDRSISLSCANHAATMDDVCMPNTSRVSARTNGIVTARARPATTGRYFNSTNGLRNLRPSPASARSRPSTAAHWAGPGLRINKVTLHAKELMT